MRLEDILTEIYGNGLYQIVLTLFGILNTAVNMYDLQTNVFMVYKPEGVTCNTTLDIEWINKEDYLKLMTDRIVTIPSNTSTEDQCYGIQQNDEQTLFKCSSWIYPRDIMSGNILMEHDLVCDKSFINEWLNVNYLLALCTGYFVAMSSDIIGRKPLYFLFIILLIGSNIAIALVRELWLLFIFMFIRGCTMSINYLSLSQIIELVPIEKRGRYTAFHWIGWSIGYTLCPSFAYFFRNWRSIKYVSSLILIGHPTLFYLFPESPRWLLVRGRKNEAVGVLKRIIKANRAKLPPNYLKRMDENVALICQESQNQKTGTSKKEGFIDGIVNRQVSAQLFVLAVSRISLHSSYFGLITLQGFLSENLYLNIFLQGVIELPSSVINWKMSEILGRRKTCVIQMLLSGACITATPFLSSIIQVKMVVGMFGKICLTCACVMSNMYTVEVLPTTLRNSGLCFCTMLSTVICAFTPLLNTYVPYYFLILVYGIPLVITATMILLYLPETKGYPLPDTIDDCQGFVRGNEAKWALRRQMKYDIKNELEILA